MKRLQIIFAHLKNIQTPIFGHFCLNQVDELIMLVCQPITLIWKIVFESPVGQLKKKIAEKF